MNRIAIAAAFAALFCIQPVSSTLHAQTIPYWDIEQLESAIEKGELRKVRAVAAEQNGKIVYRRRFSNGQVGDPVDIKSAGKSLTALAVGLAIEDGKLAGTGVKVWPFLDNARGEPFDSITVGDLLSMSSALDCNDWDGRESPGYEERMYRKRVWRDFALGLPAREYRRDADGNGPFSYCTAGVFLLGQVVEKAIGERFDLYLQRRLFDPLGIESVEWRKSRSREIQSGGQLTISDKALLKIGRLVLDQGRWQGEQLISERWIKAMLTPRHSLSEHVHYGYLWWAMPLRSPRGYEGAWMMKGNGGNIVAIVPSYDAVLLVQAENYNKRDAERYAFTALTTVLGSLKPALGPAPKPAPKD